MTNIKPRIEENTMKPHMCNIHFHAAVTYLLHVKDKYNLIPQLPCKMFYGSYCGLSSCLSSL